MKPSVDSIRPLSPAQKDFLGGYLMDGNRQAYTSQWIGFYGVPIDPKAFDAAWKSIVQRHGILRTAFDWENAARPIQVELSKTEVHVPLHRLGQSLELESFINEVKQLACIRFEKGFDIKRPPLMDFEIVYSGKLSAIIWSRHHLITDGWSLSQLYGEIFTEYSNTSFKTEVANSYAGYIDALMPLIDKPSDTEYWRKYLKENCQETYITQKFTATSSSSALDLGIDLTAGIKQVCRANKITVNTFFVSTLIDSLCRIFGTDAACIGMTETLSGITEHDELVIGPKITTLPIYGVPLYQENIDSQLIKMHKDLIRHRSHSLATIKNVCNEKASKTRAYNDLLNICYVFQNYPLELGNSNHNYPELIHEIDKSEPGAPVLMVVEPGESNIKLKVLSKDEALIQLGLNSVLKEWSCSIKRLLSLSSTISETPTEPKCSEDRLNDTGTGRLINNIYHIALKDPSRIAIIYENILVSYGELWQRIESKAHKLNEAVYSPNGLVIVKGRDDVQNIVDILSVWRTGRGHIAVDSDIASWDLFAVYQNSEVVGCIGEKGALGKLAVSYDRNSSNSNERHQDSNHELAYAVLSSGTTGKPKLIGISQKNVQAHLDARSSRYTSSDKVLLSYPLVFDGSITVLISALQAGAAIVLPSRKNIGNSKRILDLDAVLPLIYTHQITALNIVPSLFKSLISNGESKNIQSVRHIVLAAESITAEDWTFFDQILDENVEVWNEYGPSETTVCATEFQIQRKRSINYTSIPIGKAINGAQIRILNEQGKICKDNEEGEIVVLGPIVGTGYLGDAEKTRSVFISYSSEGISESAYKTGDLGFVNNDGDCVWTGRKDNQLKINGVRVNSLEIESYLKSIRGAVEVSTIISRRDRQMPTIISFSVLHTWQSADIWQAEASTALSARHLDHRIIIVSDIPRLKSGKIDQQKLLDLANSSMSNSMAGDTQQEEGIDFTSTQSEQLVQLVELFKEVLMQQHVNASSDFFELGGSSLTAMTLAALARKRFDLKLEVTDVYELATPLGIAKSWNSLKSRTANKLDSSSVIKKKQRWE